MLEQGKDAGGTKLVTQPLLAVQDERHRLGVPVPRTLTILAMPVARELHRLWLLRFALGLLILFLPSGARPWGGSARGQSLCHRNRDLLLTAF